MTLPCSVQQLYGFVVVLPPQHDNDNEYILPSHTHCSVDRSDITANATLCDLNPL